MLIFVQLIISAILASFVFLIVYYRHRAFNSIKHLCSWRSIIHHSNSPNGSNKTRIAPLNNLTPESLKPPLYRPFKSGPYQLTMGLQSLNTDEWIEIDYHYRKYIGVKRDLLNERSNDVLVYKNGTEIASREVLDMLVDHLPQRFPNMFKKTENGIDNLVTNECFDLTSKIMMHPLKIASQLVQEDLVILQYDPTDKLYHANALAVCFSGGWVPQEKFGKPLACIHIPNVPFYQEKLRNSIDRYFLKLKEDNPVQRLNWALRIDDIISKEQPFPNFYDLPASSITKENAGSIVHLHTERQTLRRLPKSKDILFTIKTYLTPIADVVLNDKDIAERLASAIRAWPPEVIKYKHVEHFQEPLLDYLDSITNVM